MVVRQLILVLVTCLVLSGLNQNAYAKQSNSLWHVTAYCACKKCCGKSDGVTASGKKAAQGRTVAINWLPFGSKVKIGPDVYTVEDRGAKSLFGTNRHPIKHVDIYFASHREALRFGSQYLPVEILQVAK